MTSKARDICTPVDVATLSPSGKLYLFYSPLSIFHLAIKFRFRHQRRRFARGPQYCPLHELLSQHTNCLRNNLKRRSSIFGSLICFPVGTGATRFTFLSATYVFLPTDFSPSSRYCAILSSPQSGLHDVKRPLKTYDDLCLGTSPGHLLIQFSS